MQKTAKRKQHKKSEKKRSIRKIKKTIHKRKKRKLSKSFKRIRASRNNRKRRKIITTDRRKLKSSVLVESDSALQVDYYGSRQKGINIVGFIHAELGIGESARLAARAIESTDIPFGLLNFPLNVATRMSDMSWEHKLLKDPQYNTNIFHLNADFIAPAYEHFGSSLFSDRHSIGYWHWELPDFPDEYVPAFKLVQEVWVCSQFVSDSISRKASVPVITIPHGIDVQFSQDLNRSYFSLPENRFLFMMMYDVQSSTMRKNPQAVIEAFKLAFAKNDPRAGLVLKVNNTGSRPDDLVAIKKLAAEQSNIYLIDRGLSRLEVNSLLQCTDCFVSLHRAEGFGLGLAEAMYLGKPVIGTNWSGNTDFMDATNSCPVNYKLVQVGQDWGPYKGYQTWAEPDVRHAADYMRKLVDNPEWRSEIAANGQHKIQTEFSPAVVGQKIKNRLTELALL